MVKFFKQTKYYNFIKEKNIFNGDLLNENNLNNAINQLKKEIDNAWSILQILRDDKPFEWQPNIEYQEGEIVYYSTKENPTLDDIRKSYFIAKERADGLDKNYAKVPTNQPLYWDRIRKLDLIPDFDSESYIKYTGNVDWTPSKDSDPVSLKYYRENLNTKLEQTLKDYIAFDNEKVFLPTGNYNPVPKIYVDNAINTMASTGTAHNADFLKGIDGDYYVRVDDNNKLIARSSDYNYIRTTTQGFLPGASSSTIGNLVDKFREMHAENFIGTALQAKYADVAEYYESDRDYEAGTILSIGGSKEVTKYSPDLPLAGIVSENPGFILNNLFDKTHKVLIGLKGRIYANTTHSIAKSEYVYVNEFGEPFGSNEKLRDYDLLGIALEDSKDNKVLLKV